MSIFTKNAVEVFAPTDLTGNPRGADMGDAQTWGMEVQHLAMLMFASGLVYDARADLFANLVPAANTPALVIGDATPGYDGLYMKVGATTTGSWQRLGDVPGYGIQSSNGSIADIIRITQSAYDALDPPSPTTLYVIIEE